MGGVLKGLFAASPAAVDELVVLGTIGLLWYCVLGLYAVLAAHQLFSPLAYATGIATVLGALGGAKRWRDGAGMAGSSQGEATANPGGSS